MRRILPVDLDKYTLLNFLRPVPMLPYVFRQIYILVLFIIIQLSFNCYVSRLSQVSVIFVDV